MLASDYDLVHRSAQDVDPAELNVKRIQYDRYGGPEELELSEVEMPRPGRGQLRIRVLAASANPMDWKIRKGQLRMMTGSAFPRGLGHDFAGVVDAVGSDVKDFAIGDEVMGATGLKQAGAFAEFVVARAKNTLPKPTGLSFEIAGALPIVAITAWTGLFDKAKLRDGQSLFVTGCMGGVGRTAAQLALEVGASVFGSCSASDREEALALGLSEVVDYRDFDVARRKGRFDVVFDTAGALSTQEVDTLLKRDGKALHIVPTPAKMIRSLVSSRHMIVFGTPTPEGLAGIAKAVASGVLAPKIAQVVSLSEAVPALVAWEAGSAPKGKLVITPMA